MPVQTEAHKQFKEYLRSGKHRVTPERFEILDAALDQNGHFGADDLYVTMKSNKSHISRATVYNTLELLHQCGILARRNFGDNISRFEASINRKNHDHLICTNCGTIKEFSSPKIQEIVDEIGEKLGFEPTGYSFNVFGKCKEKDCEHFNG